MTAIWPAGPPKVWSEIANQARVASHKGSTSSGSAREVVHGVLPGPPSFPQPAADHDQRGEEGTGEHVDDVVLAVVDERHAHREGVERQQPAQRGAEPPDAVHR